MSRHETEGIEQKASPPHASALPEGDEAAPPGVRTMAFVRWALVALMALAAAGSWAAWGRAESGVQASQSQFHCPMHPTVLQSMRGECPVCGMDLVPVSAAHGEPAASASTAAAPSGPAAAAGKYWCPMHPEVASDDPEARCAKCGGMKLLPREDAGKVEEKHAAPVAGLAPVVIDAHRAQQIGVRTAPVKWMAFGLRVRANGSIRVNEGAVAVVTSRVSGFVEQLRVRETGQRVQRGEILGTLYSADLLGAQQVFLSNRRLADRAQAQPTAAGAAFQIDPTKRLDLLGVAQQDIDRLAASGKVQSALPFRSPVTGYVARKIEASGVYVEPGTELFRIADLSSVWLTAEVTERDAKRVRVGQSVTFHPDVGSGETYRGKVEFVHPAVDEDSGTLMVRATLKNDDLALRPGMSGDVVLEVEATEGLVVPRDALVETGELQYVFVAREGGRFEPRVVQVGTRDHDHVLVLQGVSEGERVVTTANFLVDAESRLRAAVQAYTP